MKIFHCDALMLVANIIIYASTQVKREKTKKQLKDLILKRRMEKDRLIKAIGKREELIARMQAETNKPFSEIFFVYAESPGAEPLLHPVLAMCQPDPEDLMQTQLLVRWLTKPPVLGDVAVPDPDVPHSTPVEYQWVSIRELLGQQITYICGMDTKLRSSHEAAWAWHWDSSEKAEESTKGKGGKAAGKGKDKIPVSTLNPIGTPYQGSERGVFAPVLMKIFPDEVGSPPMNSEGRCEGGDVLENGDPDANAVTAPRNEHFSLCVQLQGDLCRIAQGEGATEEVTSPYQLCDDIVLVLQEVRSDGEDPLVMRVQLSKDNPLPICRTTFHIPYDKIPSSAVLFWVRVVTRASFHLCVYSPASVEVGAANEIWEKSGGVSQVITDATQPTHEKTEQVLFRLPLQLAPPMEEEGDRSDSVFLFLHTQDRGVSNTLSLVAIDNDKKETRLLPSINGNCFALKSPKSIVTVVGRCWHGSNNIPEFEWRAYILSRHLLRPPGDVIPQVVPEKIPRQRFLGEYVPNNKLRIFRDVISAPVADFPIALRLSMHSAQHEDAETKGIELVGRDTFVDVNEQLWFTARTYRKSDLQLVGEHHCRSIMQIYTLDKEGFMADATSPGEVEAGAKGSKSKPPADKKKGAKDVGDLVEFILEVTIAENRMKVPDSWRSRYPFRFRRYNTQSPLGGMDERSVDSVEVGQQPVFSWQLDVLCGKVVQMHHDLHDLERYAALKNKWDEAEPGRRGKGHNARTYVALRAGRTVEDEGATTVSELTEALGKDEAMLQAREDSLVELSQVSVLVCVRIVLSFLATLSITLIACSLIFQYTEHVEDPAEGSSVLTAEVVQREREFHAADAESVTATAESTLSKLLQFNDQYRETVLQRIAAIRSQVSLNYDEAIALWAKREEYSEDIDKKNEAIRYFLSRATEAIETAFPDENADPKAKGKAKPKKK